DRTYSWRRDGKTMVGELQAGTSDGNVTLYTPSPETMFYELWQAWAAGLCGVIHWQFQSWRSGTFELGEFGLRSAADGAETARSKSVRRFSEIFAGNRKLLLSARRKPASIAILESHSNAVMHYVQWQDKPRSPDVLMNYHRALMGCYRALNEANFRVEFLSEADVLAGALTRYKVLYLPETELLGAECAQAIRSFIENGGAVWADGRFAWLDEHMYLRHAIPGHDLASVFGAREGDFIAQSERIHAATDDGKRPCGQHVRQELVPLDNAHIHARYSDGTIASVDAQYGKGHTRLWGLSLARTLYDEDAADNARDIIDFAECAKIAPDWETPAGVTARCLDTESSVRLMMLHNYAEEPRVVSLPGEGAMLCRGKAASGEVCLESGETEIIVLPMDL
ncbi:MAG: beta-galactosidase trimerization domain-containing protein, partial [Victivallaceae bacterium]|nr:beta-galactosidase trimerization domain-containing protein [Victivallaceae bacterium]